MILRMAAIALILAPCRNVRAVCGGLWGAPITVALRFTFNDESPNVYGRRLDRATASFRLRRIPLTHVVPGIVRSVRIPELRDVRK